MTEGAPPPDPEPVARAVDAPVASTAAAVRRAAEAWGAEWDSEGAAGLAGHLRLPVTAGLRHGWVEGRLRVEPLRDLEPEGEGPAQPADPASHVTFEPERSFYYLNATAVVLLGIAGLGALLTLIWPFFPRHPEIAQIAPLGAVLALAGWFLVVSRLETRGPEEFLTLVEMEALPDEAEEGASGRT